MRFTINRDPDIRSEALPATLAGAHIAVIDHTHLPTPIARRCAGLRHIVFLGTGARSYMSPEELAGLGIAVHTIKGYGDTAVAECAIALMWAAARGFARMPRWSIAGASPGTLADQSSNVSRDHVHAILDTEEPRLSHRLVPHLAPYRICTKERRDAAIAA